MVLKGKVSSVESEGARVVFPDKENAVSSPLKIAAHVGGLQAGDNVAAIFFSDNMRDGLIIAKY